MGPYEFKDYFKFGAPLQVLFLCLGMGGKWSPKVWMVCMAFDSKFC